MVDEMSGVVVSKPTPTKTTSLSGFCSATRSPSSGEYTMRMSRPAAFSALSEEVEPGTRVMSPKVVRMTLSMRDSAMTVSMSLFAVTQTGQPGPLMSSTPSGRMLRMPLRASATVCVPHTSISLTEPPHFSTALGPTVRMTSTSSRPSSGSRKPERSSAIYIAPAATPMPGWSSSMRSGNCLMSSRVSLAYCSSTISMP